MPTSQLAGNRQHRARNPRDLTGKEYQRQQAELKAKRDAEASPVNLAAIRHDAFTRGHAQGYEAGIEEGKDIAVEALLSLSEKALLAKRAEYIAEFGNDA